MIAGAACGRRACSTPDVQALPVLGVLLSGVLYAGESPLLGVYCRLGNCETGGVLY
jgi:hypothetical protein